tara:strand:- start:3865 stop:4008 length:144 start_codon:yes stop_codon:yes gene_type:complete
VTTGAGTSDPDAQPDSVLVVVDAHLNNILNKTAGLPFAPKALQLRLQ